MRALLQRVTAGQVDVDGQTVGRIGPGLVVLVGVGQGDTAADAEKLADKTANLRIFSDPQGKFNLSLLDVAGEALVVSQFTLYADPRKGRRPSFVEAAPPELGRELCDLFAARLRELGVRKVDSGVFGANMHVTIHNDGPVTIWLDSKDL